MINGVSIYSAASIYPYNFFSVIITVISCLLTDLILIENEYSSRNISNFLRLYVCNFYGTGATFFYNLVSNILRALGDSKTPFIFPCYLHLF